MLRATRNNTFCDTLALQEKSSYEKIHTKYCKTVLGLKKTACNILTLSEYNLKWDGSAGQRVYTRG
jgi:hypothetical protein